MLDGCYRIRTEKNGGAWCPKSQISSDVYEWIQVDVGELKVITQVETQGRFGNGQVRAIHCGSWTTPAQICYMTISHHRHHEVARFSIRRIAVSWIRYRQHERLCTIRQAEDWQFDVLCVCIGSPQSSTESKVALDVGYFPLLDVTVFVFLCTDDRLIVSLFMIVTDYTKCC